MAKRIVLTPEEMERMMPYLRGAALYEVDERTTYWCVHQGKELGPKVMIHRGPE